MFGWIIGILMENERSRILVKSIKFLVNSTKILVYLTRILNRSFSTLEFQLIQLNIFFCVILFWNIHWLWDL